MKNLVLLSEQYHFLEIPNDEGRIVDFATMEDGVVVVLTSSGMLVASNNNEVTWNFSLNNVCENPSEDWFHVTFVQDLECYVCLSHSGAIVTVEMNDHNNTPVLIGEFENGIMTGSYSPDQDILALLTYNTTDTDGGKVPVLMTMNDQFEILAETSLLDSSGEGMSLCWRPCGTCMAVSSVVDGGVRQIHVYNRDGLELIALGGRSEDGSGKFVRHLQLPLAWASSGCSHYLTTIQQTKKKCSVIFLEPNGLQHGSFVVPTSGEEVQSLVWNPTSDLLAISFLCNDNDGLNYGKVQLWHRSNYHWYCKYERKFVDTTIQCMKFHNQNQLMVATSNIQEYEFVWDRSIVSHSTGIAPVIDGTCLKVTPLAHAMIPPPMCATTFTMNANINHVSTFQEWILLHLSNDTLVIIGNNNSSKHDFISSYNPPTAFGTPIDLSEITKGDSFLSLRQCLIVEDIITNDDAELYHMRVIAIATKQCNSECLVEMIVKDGKITWWSTILLEQSKRALRLVPWLDTNGGALLEYDDGTFVEYTYDSNNNDDLDGTVVQCMSFEPMLEACPWLVALKQLGTKPIIIGLSYKYRLYSGDVLLHNAVSSFLVSLHHQFLCCTTTSDLMSIPLSTLATLDPFTMGAEEMASGLGYEPRNIERGSQLVCIHPNQPTMVLQLPRGNLEGIHPRSLVLPHLMTLISSQQHYGEALRLMRKQKVDLNLLVDMNPNQFISNCHIFIQQVQAVNHNLDYLNLFISSLQNENVTQTKYPIPSWFKSTDGSINTEKEVFDYNQKVNILCQTMRNVMMESTTAMEDYLLPILSTFAKENPPKLQDALTLIRDNTTSSSRSKNPLLSEKTQSAIQYLAFLANYELLFDTALGMYDYEFAKAVARNSQMDPKVYIPLLKSYMEYPPHYSKYQVDVRLKRYESALTHLVEHYLHQQQQSDLQEENNNYKVEFPTCLELIQQHSLYKQGLQLFTQQQHPMEYRSIQIALGQHYLIQNNADVALTIFMSMEEPDYELAKKAARACCDWKTYFTLMEQESSIEETMKRSAIAYEVAEEIATGGKSGLQEKTRQGCADAAIILLDYCNKDIGEAVDMLIAGQWWLEGRRIAQLHSRKDLSKKVMDAAISYATFLMNEFEQKIDNFQEASKRYAIVLKLQQEAQKNNPVGTEDNVDDNGSLFSMASTTASSVASYMSGSSVGSTSSVVSSVISAGTVSTFSITGEIDALKHKSKYNNIGSKQKKKKKRKSKRERRQRIKPGSLEELNQLVSTLQVNIVNDGTKVDIIVDTITFLLQVGKTIHGRNLYDSYNNMSSTIQSIQQSRIEQMLNEQKEEAKNHEENHHYFEDNIVHLPCENEVNNLSCKELPSTLQEAFIYLG